MENINIKLLPMEYSVKGVSCCNEDGSYTVIINSRISQEKQIEAYYHELRHIQSGDFGTDDVEKVERVAHCM